MTTQFLCDSIDKIDINEQGQGEIEQGQGELEQGQGELEQGEGQTSPQQLAPQSTVVNKSKIKESYKNLFILTPLWKRIMIQTCKEPEDEFAYLLKNLL
jgi:hypothetical protein